MNQHHNESGMSSINLSSFRRLELDGSGTLTVVHSKSWILHKADGTPFSNKEKDFVSLLGDRLRITNAVPGNSIIVQGNGGQIGNITNSVIGSIVQNGQPVQVPSVAPYDWVLTCPLLPEDVDLEGVTTLKIDAAPFPHDAESSAWRCDISGSPNVALDACPAEQADLHVSGAANIRLDAEQRRALQPVLAVRVIG